MNAARDGREFRQVASCLPTGVTVLATLLGTEPHGATVNAFTTVSLEPLLVLASLDNRSRSLRRVRAAGTFAVTVLGDDQDDVARRFADPARPPGHAGFHGVHWRPAPSTGSPVLTGGVGYFDCRVTDLTAAGDHTIVVASVLAYGLLSDRAPLLFLRSRFIGCPQLEPEGSARP